MNKKTIFILVVSLVVLSVLAVAFFNYNGAARLPLESGFGPNPALPSPERPLLPVLNVVDATGWAAGEKPVAAEGMEVTAFAEGLDHPRWLYVLPNGDVLVAETNAPKRPDDAKGFKGWFFNYFKSQAGAGTPSADRITLLRDADGDGVVETRTIFLSGLNSPFGMALIGDQFYVANTDALVRFPYVEGETQITAAGTQVTDLPAGTINHHWTKNVVASPDGSKLYVSVGSNSDVAENGMEVEEGRAAIWEVDAQTGEKRIFASGLRNPVGMAWEPESGMLWTSVNERDELGSDLVPDYMTSVQDGGFYGWPYVYYGKHLEPRVTPNPEMAAKAIIPDYALGPHTASLGLTHSAGNTLPERFANGMFVGQHGSWNRKPFSGYKVLFVPFSGGMPSGEEPLDVLTGFIKENGDAMGRPVGVIIDKYGALLVADDVGNVIWRVTATQPE